MNTIKIRKGFNLSQKQFSDYLEIPLRTVKRWDSKNTMPEYVHDLVIKYLCSSEVNSILDEILTKEREDHNRLVLKLKQDISVLNELLQKRN